MYKFPTYGWLCKWCYIRNEDITKSCCNCNRPKPVEG